jgi:hypothetical protein
MGRVWDGKEGLINAAFSWHYNDMLFKRKMWVAAHIREGREEVL